MRAEVSRSHHALRSRQEKDHDLPEDGPGGRPQPVRLLAFCVSEGCDRYTTLGGIQRVPALVYEVVETTEQTAEGATEDGSTVYEGRIFDAGTKEMIHERPYQSTFLTAFATWWERETGAEPPLELLSGQSQDNDERLDP